MFLHRGWTLLLGLASLMPLRGQDRVESGPGPWGLRLPTPEEQAWMDDNLIQVD